MSTSNRLIKEFTDLKKENELNFKLYPEENNLHRWSGVLEGPMGTPYQVSKIDFIF